MSRPDGRVPNRTATLTLLLTLTRTSGPGVLTFFGRRPEPYDDRENACESGYS